MNYSDVSIQLIQDQVQRLAHQVRSAYYADILALKVGGVAHYVLKNAKHALRSARDKVAVLLVHILDKAALRKSAQVVRMQTVYIQLRANLMDHSVNTKLWRQRHLHKDAVDVQLLRVFNGGLKLLGCCILVQLFQSHCYSKVMASLHLRSHI